MSKAILFLLMLPVALVGVRADLAAESLSVGCSQDGLVAWYKFDGNANDSSGTGADLKTVSGSVSFGQDRRGNDGGALVLDANLSLGPDEPVVYTNSFAISTWVRTAREIELVSERTSGTYYNAENYGSLGMAVGLA